MTQNVTVEVNNQKFDVSVTGQIATDLKVNGTILDEVRLAAADQFLARKDLSRAERGYWGDIRTVTPENKRGRH